MSQIDVRELYHFIVQASAIDPDRAQFVQETAIYEVTGFNASRPLNTPLAYLIEHYGFEVQGQREDKPVVYKHKWAIIEGPGIGGLPVVTIPTTKLAQLEGAPEDRPLVVRTKLFQITQ